MTVSERNGMIIATVDGYDNILGFGTAPQVFETDITTVWFVSDAGLIKASIDNNSNVATNTVATGSYSSFSVKYSQDIGFVWAAASQNLVTYKLGDAASTKQTQWNSDDIISVSIEIDPASSSISLATVTNANVDNGFVQRFVKSSNKTLEYFYVYDFSMGPQKLPDFLKNMWN
jgi:hypothetical protein